MTENGAPGSYAVRQVTWSDARLELAAVRRTVFIEEQGVPEELEWDEDDADAVHALARTPQEVAIGTARLLRDGRIGRMAVVKSWRGRGVGSAILRFLIQAAARLGHPLPRLHAQTHALSFYARHGFAAVGEEFMEAGIPHRATVLSREPYDRARTSR